MLLLITTLSISDALIHAIEKYREKDQNTHRN